MTDTLNLIRKVLGKSFGAIAIVAGCLLLIAGIVSLALGLDVLVVGEFHGRWSAILYIPTGAVLAFVGYGSVRLGREAFQTSVPSVKLESKR